MVSRRFLRIKALKALYAHICGEEEGVIAAQKRMLFSVSKSHELYHLMLYLIVEVADYAKGKLEQSKSKKIATAEELNPSSKFVDNEMIEKIRNCESLNIFMKKNSIAWNRDNNLIGELYNNLINSDYYKVYMSTVKKSYETDKNLVIDFYRKSIEDNELLYSIIEDMSIYWIDEIEFITGKVVNYLSKVKNGADIVIPALYQNDDDKEFVKDLFVQSLLQYDENVEILKKYAKNWEVERITVMDRLIVIMSIVEFEKFHTIPVNVTFDEYIEISKHYSTNNSNIFINGILNKYTKDHNIVK